MSFVEVPAEKLREILNKAEFTQGQTGSEETWERTHLRNPRYKIKVYTSIQVGKGLTRGCGDDAIRVVVTYTNVANQEKGIWKSKRIYRTGTVDKVCDRLLERMREAYGWVNEQLKNKENKS